MKVREHVACSRQLHGGGNGKLLSEHVVGHTSRFFYGVWLSGGLE
jgi:hypothetical protein